MRHVARAARDERDHQAEDGSERQSHGVVYTGAWWGGRRRCFGPRTPLSAIDAPPPRKYTGAVTQAEGYDRGAKAQHYEARAGDRLGLVSVGASLDVAAVFENPLAAGVG